MLLREEKEGMDTELSEASLSPYMVTDPSETDEEGTLVEETEEEEEEESEAQDRSHRESINLLRRLYNEANYGIHFASLGKEEGTKYKNRILASISPYIKRHKPSLNVRKTKPSKVGHRILTRSPIKRGQQKPGNLLSFKPSTTKNFIKENIESVKTSRWTRKEEEGKTRVVYDVEYAGCVYRVLPCHVKSTPNCSVLSVNIEEDLWVDVPRSAGKLDYVISSYFQHSQFPTMTGF